MKQIRVRECQECPFYENEMTEKGVKRFCNFSKSPLDKSEVFVLNREEIIGGKISENCLLDDYSYKQ